MREEINKIINLRKDLNKSNLEKVFINGFQYYLDRNKLVIYEKEDDTNGISIYSNKLTQNEKDQLWNYIKFGR